MANTVRRRTTNAAVVGFIGLNAAADRNEISSTVLLPLY